MIRIGILGDIGSGKSYVAKLFGSEIKYLPFRAGERFASSLTNMNLSNKVHKRFGKIKLKEYINNFVKNYKWEIC